MKTKIIDIMGGELIFEIDCPSDLEDKEKIENKRTEYTCKFITELLRREFEPTKEEIREIVKKDLGI